MDVCSGTPSILTSPLTIDLSNFFRSEIEFFIFSKLAVLPGFLKKVDVFGYLEKKVSLVLLFNDFNTLLIISVFTFLSPPDENKVSYAASISSSNVLYKSSITPFILIPASFWDPSGNFKTALVKSVSDFSKA